MEKKKIVFESRYPKIYMIYEMIWKLLILNLFFVIFSLLGGIIFGIGPAIAATKRLIFDWSNKEYPPMFKTLLSYFRTSFWMHNLVFYASILLFLGVGFNFYFFYLNLEPSWIRTSGLILNVIVFIYIWTAFHMIFMMRHGFSLTWKESLIFSMRYVWGFPKEVFLVLGMHLVTAVLTYLMPQIMIFFAYGMLMMSISIITKALQKKFDLIDLED